MLNGTNPSIDKGTVRQGLEDAGMVGGIALVAILLTHATEGLPTIETLYAAGLAALMAGLLSYARARQIQVPPRR